MQIAIKDGMKNSNKNKRTALNLFALVVGMVLLSYASVPFYRLFCKVTGFGGTTGEATFIPDKVYNRELVVQFNTDVSPELPWKFVPEQRSIKLKVGEQKLAFFKATNEGSEAMDGVSTFNATPDEVGQYFMKIKCFCYEAQRIEPGETVEMPVSFFIDPALLENHGLDKLTTITLSYTFFKVKDSK